MTVIIILLKNYLGVTEEGASKKSVGRFLLFFLKRGGGQIILFDEQVLYWYCQCMFVLVASVFDSNLSLKCVTTFIGIYIKYESIMAKLNSDAFIFG